MHEDAITLADELKEVLVVLGESRPGVCHTGADELGPVEVRDTIKAALAPDDLGQLPHECFVALDWVGVPRRCARRHCGTAGEEIVILQIRDGKVCRQRGIADNLNALRQLGVMPTPRS